MSARRDVPVLDRFRLLAAFLAVCNHTAPLAGLAPEADFWLTRVLARIAVPFFLMVSGYFLSRDGWRGTGRFLKRTLTLYARRSSALSAPELVQRGLLPPGVAQKAAHRRHPVPPVVFPGGPAGGGDRPPAWPGWGCPPPWRLPCSST